RCSPAPAISAPGRSSPRSCEPATRSRSQRIRIRKDNPVIDRHHARRARIPVRAAALAVVGVLTLAGCGSSNGSSSAASVVTSPSTGGSAVPAQDVVSGIAEDQELHAELPASVRSSGQLILGTTLNPGTSNLPHAGQVNGQNVGLDVDLRNAVAKVLGVTW